jgi:hypothetical protein
MKISKLSLVGIVLLGALAFVMPAMAIGNGADVGQGIGCGINTGGYGTFKTSLGFGYLLTENSNFVMNNINWKLACHGQITENFPTKAFNYGGRVGCKTFGNFF